MQRMAKGFRCEVKHLRISIRTVLSRLPSNCASQFAKGMPIGTFLGGRHSPADPDRSEASNEQRGTGVFVTVLRMLVWTGGLRIGSVRARKIVGVKRSRCGPGQNRQGNDGLRRARTGSGLTHGKLVPVTQRASAARGRRGEKGVTLRSARREAVALDQSRN
jgi:hypothetical protein